MNSSRESPVMGLGSIESLAKAKISTQNLSYAATDTSMKGSEDSGYGSERNYIKHWVPDPNGKLKSDLGFRVHSTESKIVTSTLRCNKSGRMVEVIDTRNDRIFRYDPAEPRSCDRFKSVESRYNPAVPRSCDKFKRVESWIDSGKIARQDVRPLSIGSSVWGKSTLDPVSSPHQSGSNADPQTLEKLSLQQGGEQPSQHQPELRIVSDHKLSRYKAIAPSQL